jgi:hypothetical protein
MRSADVGKCRSVIADSTADKAYNAPTSPVTRPAINIA